MSTQLKLACALRTAAALGAFAHGALPCAAQTAAMQEVIIKGEKSAVPAHSPSSVESISASQIAATINAVTSAEALNYLPSTHVRERYIGDRNAILVMRVNSSVASAQTTVYADHLLLSNFLNNSYSSAPRWGMVGPEEIERVELMYGPFSALYPGNSAGGVVLMTTRMPDRFEAHAKVDLFGQRFKLYGTEQNYAGSHTSASIGNTAGSWSFRIGADHLDNHGHPQTFGVAAKAFPADAPAATAVSGEQRDIDSTGQARIVTSAIGADHTVQDIGKIKLEYALSPTLRAAYSVGLWQNRSDSGVSSYLRDASGTAVYNTARSGPARYVKFAGDAAYYTLSGAAPASAEGTHTMHGLALASHTHGAWDWQAIASIYTENRERARSATSSGGTLTVGDGTGWANLDLRGEWRTGRHKVSAGYHRDRYVLKSLTSAVAGNWQRGAGATPSSSSYGKTQTEAIYLQDAWQVDPAWTAVAGARIEHWRAFDGSNFNAANAAPYRQLVHAERSSTGFSPKASLSYLGWQEWTLRGSLGRAMRYPTVAEIFQVISLPDNVKQNDPTLKAEDVRAAELAAERSLEGGMLRTSLFWEDKRDALIAQLDTTVTPTVSSIQNVDRVRTYGVEAVLNLRDALHPGFDLSGSLTYANSTIVKDSRNPGLAGTDQPRIPDWRATLVGTWRASERLSYSASYRYSGRQHNTLFNTQSRRYNDVNPGVYGGVSRYSVLDAKIVYRVAPRWSASAGVNNIGSFKYYVNPNPYPQRTFFTSLQFDY